MQPILVLKTGALGDVLRTTSILPGLRAQQPDARVTWLTAPGARELVERHPLVDEVVCADPRDAGELERVRARLASTRWSRVLSFDDEEPLCALASALETERLSGAFLDARGERAYTDDVAPWFDMGLLSRFGKERADALKLANRESHAAIFARMLGVEPGEPELPLGAEALAFGEAFARRHDLPGRTAIGLNTGAGGRWTSKQLPVATTVDLAEALARAVPASFVVLGGPPERARNDELLAALAARGVEAVDGGTENSISEFAAIVSQLALLITSDSLALHVAVARRVPVTAFFAPTSEAEIELYGRGTKVRSTAPDYCTYRPDVDTSTLTVERLLPAALASLALTDGEGRGPLAS